MRSHLQYRLPGLRLTAIASCMLALYGTAGSQLLQAEPISTNVAMHIPGRNHNPRDLQRKRAGTLQNRRPGRMATRPPAPVRPAATVPVTNCNDDGPGSLRQVLVNAVDGDTVDLTGLTCNTITLTSGALYSYGALTIEGPGRDLLTIDGNANDLVLFHGFGNGLTIKGLTITNGRTSDGVGGCIWADGDVQLRDSLVSGCVAGDGSNEGAYGAGIDVIGNLTLTNSIVSGNTAQAAEDVFGGGTYSRGDTVVKYLSRVESNSAIAQNGYARGGGVFAQGSVNVNTLVTIADNRVESTEGTAYGGGVYAYGSTVDVSSATISGNTAHSAEQWSYGGGIQAGRYYSPSDISLRNATVTGNTSSAGCAYCFIQGGGANAFGTIHSVASTIRDNMVISDPDSNGAARGGGLATWGYYGTDTITLQQSTVSGNSALGGNGGYGIGYGGGIAAITGNVQIGNSTVAFNTASTHAGGVAAGGGYYALESQLVSSIVANNQAPSAADMGASYYSSSALDVSGDHNLIVSVGSNVNLPADTINADPQLLPLANNGGSTATHALAACSPAIDAGSNPDALEYDQRGSPFVRAWGVAADIGAFELQADPDRIFSDGFDSSPCP